jgi:RNA polymerase sigma factor (sigma-70 family)
MKHTGHNYSPFIVKLKQLESSSCVNLLEQFKNDGNLATKKVYDVLRPLAISHAYDLCREGVLARELADEAFVSLWMNRSKIRDWNHVGGYFSLAVLSRFCDHIRTEKKRRIRLMNYCNDPLSDHETVNVPEFEIKLTKIEKDMVYRAQIEWLAANVLDLQDRVRTAFIMKYIKGMNTMDIRNEMGLSRIKIVTNYTNRAIKKLTEKAYEDGIKI